MLTNYGLDDRVRALLADAPGPRLGLPIGRVVRIDRGRALIITDDGERSRPPIDGLAVGDWVVLDQHRICAVAQRWSQLTRTDPRSEGRTVDAMHVLAANVDVVFVVEPLDRPLRLSRIDRALAMVWETGAVPLVVLTKADLHSDPEAVAAELSGSLHGVDVVLTSTGPAVAGPGGGVDALAAALRPCRTGVLVGLSGAGKSSLLNALAGDNVMATGSVRDEDRRGRHTTSVRHLVALRGGGVLIDQPGLRSMGLWDAQDGVRAVFDDIDELAARCRFSDCRHQREPGCAVLSAIEGGLVQAGRLERWRKLEREVDLARRRQDPALEAEHKAEVKRFGRARRADPSTYRKR